MTSMQHIVNGEVFRGCNDVGQRNTSKDQRGESVGVEEPAERAGRGKQKNSWRKLGGDFWIFLSVKYLITDVSR